MNVLKAKHAKRPPGTCGGVLSDGAILAEVARGTLIVGHTFEPTALQPASYDVAVACDGLIAPSGEEFSPGTGGTPKRVVLQPGDTAMFSTTEVLCMPKAIAGNITIKNRLAAEGLLLLSGGLIDPGYGHDEKDDGKLGCRLFLHVANISQETIEIRPGSERIARIQFLRVCGPESADRVPIQASRWKGQKRASLGFLSELKELKDSSERNRDLINYVIAGVGFVLLMTLLSVALAVILSLGSDGKLLTATRAAVPQSASGRWLGAALVAGLSVLVLGFGIALLCVIKRGHRAKG
jgi:deoxycytidine triphosphate deaminase